MSFNLEITEARHAQELRSGFMFRILNEQGRVTCSGRIKPSGTFAYTGAFPNKLVSDRMHSIAKAYHEEGIAPEDCTFEEPVAGAPVDSDKPKPKKRKERKATKGE